MESTTKNTKNTKNTTNNYRKRPPSSGYTRTDIIGNYDLHPGEGYEFPFQDEKKITLNTKTSAMFPLNRKINDKVQPSHVCEKEPEGVIDPVMPQTRKFRSKLIYDTMVKTTAKQRDYAAQKRLYDQDVKQAEAETEMHQIELAKQKDEKEAIKRMRKKQELDQTYKDQLAAVERQKELERIEIKKYEEQLRLQNKAAQKVEDERLARLRQIAEERRAEFRVRNDELLMRKEHKREIDMEEEKKIAAENAEVQKRQDSRKVEDERRRMVKTNMRSRVVEQRAKDLERQLSKNNQEQEMAESAAAKAAAKHVQELREKQDQLLEDRHNEWLNLQRERLAKKRNGAKKPFPTRKQEVDALLYDQQQRKREQHRIKDYQYAQIEERKRKEKEEIENDILEDNRMIAATQAKFNKSLKQLQTLIPEELGITVPEYTVSRSITKFH